MKTTRKVCHCGVKSVPGLKPGIALCQEHFNGLFHASTDSKEHSEAVTTLHKQGAWVYSERRD